MNPSLKYIPSSYKEGKTYSVIPANGDGDFVFSRASEGSRVDENGDIETMAIDVPRLQYPSCPSLLLEPSRTNIFLNSFVPVTQTVTVVNATSYAISCGGEGSIALTGAITGTVTEGNPIIDTSTTTSLTLTITGSLDWVQVEVGTDTTMPIETLGTTVTRAIENLALSGLQTNGILGATEGTWFIEFGDAEIASNSNRRSFCIYELTTNNNSIVIASNIGDKSIKLKKYEGTVMTDIKTIVNGFDNSKIALAWSNGNLLCYVNGTLEISTTLTASPYVYYGGQGVSSTKNVKQMQFYPTDLTDEELIILTT